MDYYGILGVSRSASEKEIKAAFRKLAKQFHPDKDQSPQAAQRFKEAYSAYVFLKDNAKRNQYDSEQQIDKITGPDLKVSFSAKAEDMIKCAVKNLAIKRRGKCPECDGSGSVSKKTKRCLYCRGTGFQGLSLIIKPKKKCLYCGGEKIIPDGPLCKNCNGKGIVEEVLRAKIKLSPLSYLVELPRLGHYAIGAELPGNCIIDVSIIQPSGFLIRGLNIESQLTVSPAQAILGDTVGIFFFDRRIDFKLPAGVQSGQVLCQRESGLSYGGKKGYFKARITVQIPQVITNKEKELYQELLSIEKEISVCPKQIALT